MTSGDRPGRVVADRRGGNLALDLFVLSQHLGALLEAALRPTGITPAQYAVYSLLAEGPQSPTNLVEALGLRPATLSGYLSVMEARGDLSRDRDPGDRRSHRIELTPAGRTAHQQARAAFRVVVRDLDRRLGGPSAVARARGELGALDAAIVALLEARG